MGAVSSTTSRRHYNPPETTTIPGKTLPTFELAKGIMPGYDEGRFHEQLNSALTKVAKILDNTRHPTFPAEVPHRYDDKFLLAEFLVSTAMAAQLNCFETLGMTEKEMKKCKEWATTRTVTLRFKSEEKCEFDRKAKREIESDTHVSTTTGYGMKQARKTKTITTVTDYYWKFTVSYELFVFQGNDPSTKVSLMSKTRTHTLMVTDDEKTPYPKSSVQDPIDLDVTWLLVTINRAGHLRFSINRANPQCRTPRRNPEIQMALGHFSGFYVWCDAVRHYFESHVFPIQRGHSLDLSATNASSVFVPVLPLFEERKKKKSSSKSKSKSIKSPRGEKSSELTSPRSSSTPRGESEKSSRGPALPASEINTFIQEQVRTLHAKTAEIEKMFPKEDKLITSSEATLLVVFKHGMELSVAFGSGVDYIEDMLMKQLVGAIGKVLQPVDFASYMTFHNRQLFNKAYEPRPFCYAVRRPGYCPEGSLSVEVKVGPEAIPEPVLSTTRYIPQGHAMHVSLSPSVKAGLVGEHFLHSVISTKFSGTSGLEYSLVARARQFSSFILMVGSIPAPDLFEPKFSIVIKNKDDLRIPLIMEQLPSAKEFKDATASLSPEQKRFCKQYRSMQLSSTLFGVAIVQIKPQLEKLLNLPDNSLTKEIRLTQDLEELFIQYQIPSDLLSFNGKPEAHVSEKINAIKKHVAAMNQMLESMKKSQIQERREEALKRESPPRVRQLLRKASYNESESECEDDGECSEGDMMMLECCEAPMLSAAMLPDIVAEIPAAPPAEAKPADKPEEPKELSLEAVITAKKFDIDYTKLPSILDKKYKKLDEDAALRPTIIKAGDTWVLNSYPSLVSPMQTSSIEQARQIEEKKRSFDLLDALSRSGALSIDKSQFHIILAATHCFDKTLVNTIVQDNVNPIEKVERSLLIIATSIHDQPVTQLVKEQHLERIQQFSPTLFLEQK